MERKKLKILAVIMVILLAAVAVYAVVQEWNNQPKEITGTYCMDNVNPTLNVYVSFVSDGTFQIYNPNREMYSGTYQEETGMITDQEYMYIALHLSDGTKGYAVFDRHDRVILDRTNMLNLPEQLRPFIRISDTPSLLTEAKTE